MTAGGVCSIDCLTASMAKLTRPNRRQIAKSSQDTASRDIDDLVKRGVLRKDAAGGRSTSYSLVGS